MPAFVACNEEKAAIKRAVNERAVIYLRYNNFYLELLSILKKFISLHNILSIMNILETYTLANAYLTSRLPHVKESVMWSRVRQGKKKNILALVRRGVYLPVEINNKFINFCNAVKAGVISYHSSLVYYLLQTPGFKAM